MVNPVIGDNTMDPIHPHQLMSYDDALDHLSDEIAWVTARCHHLGARIEAVNEAADHAGLATATTDGDRVSQPTRQKIARLAAADDNLRNRIDGRVRASEAAGRVLPLRRLRDQFKLDEVEARTLLLATVPCLGFDLYTTMSSLGQFSFGLMSISPEMIAVFGGLDLAGRVSLRDQLADEGKLVQAGLVEADWNDERVADFWASGVHLTEKTYCQIVGKSSVTFDPDNVICPLCGPAVKWGTN